MLACAGSRFIAGEEMVRMKPWYRGFKGLIEENATKTAFETIGLIEKTGEDVVEISELPIKRWTQVSITKIVLQRIIGGLCGWRSPATSGLSVNALLCNWKHV